MLFYPWHRCVFRNLEFLVWIAKIHLRVFISTDILRNSWNYTVDSICFKTSGKLSRWPDSKIDGGCLDIMTLLQGQSYFSSWLSAWNDGLVIHSAIYQCQGFLTTPLFTDGIMIDVLKKPSSILAMIPCKRFDSMIPCEWYTQVIHSNINPRSGQYLTHAQMRAQPYHLDSGSYGQLSRPCLASSA